MNLYIAIGKPHIHRASAAVRTVLFLIIIYPATSGFGLTGAASATLIGMCSSLAVQLVYLKKLINLRLYDYFNCWLQGLVLSLFVVIPGVLFNIFFSSQRITAIVIGILSCFIVWGLGLYKIKLFRHSIIVSKS
jgi:O-antigen/teichoic acid export membrane protein